MVAPHGPALTARRDNVSALPDGFAIDLCTATCLNASLSFNISGSIGATNYCPLWNVQVTTLIDIVSGDHLCFLLLWDEVT